MSIKQTEELALQLDSVEADLCGLQYRVQSVRKALEKQIGKPVGLQYEHVLIARQKVAAEDIAGFVEHLRDDYLSTTEPVKRVARLIRERYGLTGGNPE